jgi:hypothetical protein
LRVRLRGAAVTGLAADVSFAGLAADVPVAFGRRGRFVAFVSFGVVANPVSVRGIAQVGTSWRPSKST